MAEPKHVGRGTVGTVLQLRSHLRVLCCMAHLLAKLGRAALEPQLVNGVWHKAAVSAKNAARLRREALLSGECVPAQSPGRRCQRAGVYPMRTGLPYAVVSKPAHGA